MIRHILNITIRIIRKNSIFSLLNILSLTLGIIPLILFALLYQYEYSFDAFHPNSDRIYRVIMEYQHPGGSFTSVSTAPTLADAIKEEFPTSGEVLSMYNNVQPVKVSRGDRVFNERKGLWVDSNFFSFFKVNLIRGNKEKVFAEHHSIVITEDFARKYFDKEDPIGETIDIQTWINGGSEYPFGDHKPNPSGIDPAGPYIVTGIIEKMPDNSHIEFDFLMSMSSIQWWDMWDNGLFGYNNTATYVKLSESETDENFISKLNSIVEKYHKKSSETIFSKTYSELKQEGRENTYSLLPLDQIRYGTENMRSARFMKTGEFQNLYYLGIISLISILVGCINFINLSTARSNARMKEVGIRKVNGSGRNQLMMLLIFEAVVLTLTGLVIGILATAIFIPYINDFLDSNLQLSGLLDTEVVFFLLIGAIVVILFSGVYPAYMISRPNPVNVLKGFVTNVKNKSFFRNSLVVIQYGVSICFILGAIVVYSQLNFLRTKDLGFSQEGVIIIQGSPNLNFMFDNSNSKYLDFKNRVTSVVDVNGISAFTNFIGYNTPVICNLRLLGEPVEDESTIFHMGYGDISILKNLNIEVKQGGKNFSGISYFLTESAIERLGIKDPIGNYLVRTWPYETGQWKADLDTIKIAGVIQDLYYNSALSQAEPVVLGLYNDTEKRRINISSIYININHDNLNKALTEIEEIWEMVAPGEPFEYTYLESELNNFYRKENNLNSMILTFSFVSVLISALGVLGFSIFLVNRKKKEISIRKIFGAQVFGLTYILVKNHLFLLIIALGLFLPISYLLSSNWLMNYPQRISMQVNYFIITILIILIISGMSLSWQVFRGIRQNPIDSIRNE